MTNGWVEGKMGNSASKTLIIVLGMASIALTSSFAAEQGVSFTAFVPSSAGALTFGPDRAYAEGFGETAGLRLVAGNKGSQTSTLRFEAFDAAFRPINTVDLPAPTKLYPGDTRSFLAIVPIMKDVKNRVRICAVLSAPSVRENRLCGRYIARQR